MKIRRSKFALALVLTAILSVSATYAATSGVSIFHRAPKVSVNVFVLSETARGTELLGSGNVITDIGEQYTRNILGFDNETAHNATKWISLSNDATPLQTWTKLPNEATTAGFGRALGTVVGWTRSSDFSYNVTKKFTASGTLQIQCAGLQWSGTASSDTNLFACAAFTQTTFNLNDNCTITWIIQIDAN